MTGSPAAERVTESFIDGEPVRSAATYPNVDPSTGATLGHVARAGGKEIDQAVAAPPPARTAVHLARLATEAGLPAGVVNVVTGLGPEAGAALAAHPGVDHLSFVGSTEVGSLIAGAAARRVAPVTLELGGKSAHLVFADADVERAATVAANAILQNAGQTCSAGSRLLVDERVHDELLRRIADRFAAVSIGPGVTDPDLGPLVSRKQQERVRGYVESAPDAEPASGA